MERIGNSKGLVQTILNHPPVCLTGCTTALSVATPPPPPPPVPKYVTELRLLNLRGKEMMKDPLWRTIETNLNPRGAAIYLSYRLDTDESAAIRDIRVIIPGPNETARDRLPRGYTLMDVDLHKNVLSAPPTYLCYCTRTGAAKSQRPITAIECTTVDELPFLLSTNFVRVQGDFGGNCNANSKTHIYLSLSVSPCTKLL